MPSQIQAAGLGEFVADIDARGGLASEAFRVARDAFALRYETRVDVTLDPYGPEYLAQQMALYDELTGRNGYTTDNEYTHFELETHAAAANAYGIRSPTTLVRHYLRLGELVQLASLPDAPRVLDLGAGWGLSSEFLALLGAEVTAVDVNPLFVKLIQRRAIRLGYPIEAQQGVFEALPETEPQDFVLFYECLHHSARPWAVLRDCAKRLRWGGKIGLAGEPIQDFWWPAWGMRLDAESLYCVRKFGWFESGWSAPFLADMCERAGLHLDLRTSPTPEVGLVGIATIAPLRTGDVHCGEGWIPEGDQAVSTGQAALHLHASRPVALKVNNHRGRPIRYEVRGQGGSHSAGTLGPGVNALWLDPEIYGSQVFIESERWVPAEELGTADTRTLSFHVEGIGAN